MPVFPACCAGHRFRLDAGASTEPRCTQQFAIAGLEGLKKSKPAAFTNADFAKLVTVGNLTMTWPSSPNAMDRSRQWFENLEIKRALLKKVETVRKPGTYITTNTSGLPVASINEGFSEDFRRNWSARTSSIRRVTCGCWRSSPRPRAIAPRSRQSRTSVICD